MHCYRAHGKHSDRCVPAKKKHEQMARSTTDIVNPDSIGREWVCGTACWYRAKLLVSEDGTMSETAGCTTQVALLF